jgi:DNA-binding winged helix-turn-helix (wHTH) protein/TolB-like protein
LSANFGSFYSVNLTVSKNENIYRVGDLTVDAENFRARRNGQNVALTPRGFDVLLLLVKNAGRVVEKQEIFETVWKETFVSDNALTKIVKEIRHALDDDAGNPRYIETVPKRGYRFTGQKEEIFATDFAAADAGTNFIATQPAIAAAPTALTSSGNGHLYAQKESVFAVEELTPDQSRPAQVSPRQTQPITRGFRFSKTETVAAALALILVLSVIGWFLYRQTQSENASIRSIGVLPFKPLNADSRDESLEMGMAETLVTRLSNLRQIVVRPMSATRKYADLQQDPLKAGREIQAEAILDGSIQKAGDRIRVTARLLKVADGAPLWSDQFDENFTDIFRVQDSIAERVTNALPLTLTGREREQLTKHYTDSPEAYQLYLRGQLVWHGRRPNWIEQSLEYYRQALEKDPNFALAHIGAAECYMMLSGHRMMPMREAEAKARPSIMRALEIDDSLAVARNALAELKYQFEYDWAGAETEFKKAVALNPNIAWIRQAYGWFLMSQARFDEAAAEMDKARELDPSSLTINVGRGRLYYFSRQYDLALRHFQNIIVIEPNDGSARYALHTIYEQKRMNAEAFEWFLKTRGGPRLAPAVEAEMRKAFNAGGWRGFLQKQVEFMESRPRRDRIDPYSFASLYVRLGRKEEAFVWLEKAFERGDPALIQLKIDPIYDVLRDDPRYARLLRRMNLQP